MAAKRPKSPLKGKKKYTAYMCSHTHWDREWYGSFQNFRVRLVRLIDRLLDLLERDPDFKYFTLDGQTVVLEDYLEIRPENRARLEKLIRDGRIVIGPWYILPDEWLVSGESTVRNLLRGRAICREFGREPARVGYLPDMFGHISQMPQLLNGFGLDNAIIFRGLSKPGLMSELWWEAPDGTRVLTFHLPPHGAYSNAAFFYHSLPAEAKTLPEGTPGGKVVVEDIDFTVGALRHIADHAIARSRSKRLLFMNGVDHMEAQQQIPEIIRQANAKYDDFETVHATMEQCLTAVRENSPADLQKVTGELRSTSVVPGGWASVLPNILSSRIYLKIANARCQTLLEKWVEPFASAAAWLGQEFPQGFIHNAWMWALRNHPHDSIGGCSIDAVHQDMEARFRWSEEIAENTLGAALWGITEAIDTESLGEREGAFFLFNPLNWEVSDLVVTHVDVEESWLNRMGIHVDGSNVYLSVRNLTLTDWAGKPVKFEILDVQRHTWYRPWLTRWDANPMVVRFKVALWAEKLPPCGYKGYRVGLPRIQNRTVNRHGTTNPACMQNEHMTVEFNPNGTLSISGPITGGDTLTSLHYLEDGGDNGDGYTYSMPRHDEVVSSLGGHVQISRLTDSDAVQSVAVDYGMQVPAGLRTDRQHRSVDTVEMNVRSVFRLGAKSKRLDVETTVTNPARDHRLRICFDVPSTGDTHVAETQFDIVERPNRVVQPDEPVWIEDMPLEQPLQQFVSNSKLAIATFGLPEYEVVPGTDEDVIKVTLMRAANFLGAWVYPNTAMGGAGPYIETPDQQMIGRTLTFRYSIIPHRGDWQQAGVQREAYQHNALWRGAFAEKHAGTLKPAGGCFVDVQGDGIVVSALKQVDGVPGDYVVRFWNSGKKTSAAKLRWFRRPTKALVSNLAEDPLVELSVDKSACSRVNVKPKQIVTVRFRMASKDRRAWR